MKRKIREDMTEKEISHVLSSSCSLSTHRILDLYIYTCELKLRGRGDKKTKNQSVTTRGESRMETECNNYNKL